ncbi:MAG: 5-demethoxyubiquinol-8 5-hydroxylase UbiM [Proteobacteria bacterium]|nr:5-demethoxyubiquinol-8 5-hydroxylase UbiM [Pseudomonadota bacterium]
MDAHVIIVGAGPAGLCLARALAQRGLNVEVVERQSRDALAQPAFDGREIALTHASMRMLRALDVWTHLPTDEIAPLRRARIMDGADEFKVDAVDFAQDRLGALVSNHLIRAAAWQAVAADPGIRVRTDAKVEAAGSNDDHAWIRLADGELLRAPLLIAADSRFSETRRAMGIPARMHDFGRAMLVCRMRHTEPHHGDAWEWFGREQTRAVLPLREHLASIVLTVPATQAQRLREAPADAFAREIETRFEHRLGAMELASTVHVYPLVATWAQRFVGHRFALAGDAAVGMHPVTAHGFNLGLASVEHLAQAVGEAHARSRDPADPALLARYQRRHRLGSLPLFLGTRAVVEVFASARPLMQPLRHAMIEAGRRLPPLRRALAAGLLDESPRPTSLLAHLRLGAQILRPRLLRQSI